MNNHAEPYIVPDGTLLEVVGDYPNSAYRTHMKACGLDEYRNLNIGSKCVLLKHLKKTHVNNMLILDSCGEVHNLSFALQWTVFFKLVQS